MTTIPASQRAEVLAVLRRGLGRIRTHWGSANGINDLERLPPGTVCAAAALFHDPTTGQSDYGHQVRIDVPAWDEAFHLLEWTLDEEVATDLVVWNDAQTSNAPVVALYERAIAALEAEEADDG